MSRRQSRVSVEPRQNDTLLEFETFKKKFLLANKHITKLNSTLSVRIEELNAQISTLYVENLRLRASEIALASQLKREREKSRRIVADAEAATHSLIKHLGHIRRSFDVPHGRGSSSDDQPPLPRAKRPTFNPDASPPPNRLARAPSMSGILEDEEPPISSSGDPDADGEDEEKEPSPARRRKSKPRTSESQLPMPTRAPLFNDVQRVDPEDQLGKASKRKPTRRQSGLLTSVSITTVTAGGVSKEVLSPRPPSPAFGSPLRREVGLAEAAEEENAEVAFEEQEVEEMMRNAVKREKKERRKEREATATERSKDKDKERRKTKDVDMAVAPEGSTSKLKDVTNSRADRTAFSYNIETGNDLRRKPTLDHHEPITKPASSSASTTLARNFLSTPTTARPTLTSHSSREPTPRSSSPVAVPAPSDPEPVGGRERRTRKSVNYAEPKLNTKMRKPDPPPPVAKRASTSSSDEAGSHRSSPEASSQPASALDCEAPDCEAPLQPTIEVRRKRSRVHVAVDDEESEGAQADAEYGGGLRAAGSYTSHDGRRRSVQSSSSSRRADGDETRRHSMAI